MFDKRMMKRENLNRQIISLGCFCGVAQELGRIGLRNVSYPFDWLITVSIENIIELIENDFQDFLSYEYLEQSNKQRKYYYNSKHKLWFYHDFSKYLSLDKQLDAVKTKYKRCIERFYEDIKKPKDLYEIAKCLS